MILIVDRAPASLDAADGAPPAARTRRRSRAPARCRRSTRRTARAPAARRARSPRRSSGARSAGARAERVGQREQDAPDFLGLLLLERDDVVVDFDRAERLEKQARAARRRAVHDARNRAAVLGLDDEHVAAVPLGDDLVLQVLRRLLAAQVRLERAAQARALLPQPIANQLQLRARVDRRRRRTGRSCRATCADLALERRGAAARRLEQRERARRAADGRRATRPPSRETRPAPAAAAASSARPSTASAARICGRSLDARSGNSALRGEVPRGFGRGGEQLRHLLRVGRRREPRQPLVAHRRQREAADGLDDAIEFEGPQGSRLHR